MNYLNKLCSLFEHKTINGKEWIEKSMSEKYGDNWLDECMKALEDPNVRVDLKKILKL